MNDVTAVIQVYYPERHSYIYRIISAIRLAGIERVIIWNNNPEKYDTVTCAATAMEGVEHIQCSFDTLVGQYAAALLASTPVIYCQNDDLLVYPETIKRMRQHVEGDRFVTLSGVMLNRESDKPYSESTAQSYGPCDVMQGRSWMAFKRALIPGITESLKHNIYPGLGEDLFFSFGKAYVLPEAEFTNLDEGETGLSRLPGHTEERDRWATRMLATV